MKQFELTQDQVYRITDDISDGEIQLKIDDINKFTLYSGLTLNDTFDQLDMSVEDIEDVEVILDEICYELEEDIFESELFSKSINFLEQYIKRFNNDNLSCYSESNIIDGEHNMYMVIRSEDVIEKIKTLKSILKDKNSIETLDNYFDDDYLEDLNDDDFYIIPLSTVVVN
ncbi:hypothetical protein CLU83_3196 [Flavobacterium sp. 1]|uniref:hypothetical protein n=1 Tax=Flavobacterium sp. 1 TaxID=2035200 RepID=UPI000C240B65|nr:hypothetical protein [Flavobacterium sp. 1]PJJ09819.1 hypothetical protein CLU83_3196 [Flavobacterium sp. 1]